MIEEYIHHAKDWLDAPIDGWFLMGWSVVIGGCWWVADAFEDYHKRMNPFK